MLVHACNHYFCNLWQKHNIIKCYEELAVNDKTSLFIINVEIFIFKVIFLHLSLLASSDFFINFIIDTKYTFEKNLLSLSGL